MVPVPVKGQQRCLNISCELLSPWTIASDFPGDHHVWKLSQNVSFFIDTSETRKIGNVFKNLKFRVKSQQNFKVQFKQFLAQKFKYWIDFELYNFGAKIQISKIDLILNCNVKRGQNCSYNCTILAQKFKYSKIRDSIKIQMRHIWVIFKHCRNKERGCFALLKNVYCEPFMRGWLSLGGEKWLVMALLD